MKALVTGGGGFLGQHLVRALLHRGDKVVSFSRGEYPELVTLGCQHVAGDVTDPQAVLQAAEGVDVVFHVAAKAGIWGPYDDFYRINTLGTLNVIEASRRLQIPKLIYTSSPSVIFNGRDMEGVDERVPYPTHYEAHYSKTKALAEQAVLKANDGKLLTTALRPHLIWGPGDNHLIPRIVARARAGQLRRIGPGGKLVDTVYVENAVDAHLLAADRLTPGSPIAGRAYFIANDEPVETWSFINRILELAGTTPLTRSVPVGVALLAANVLESVHSLFRLRGEPRLTRFVVKELATAHWFDLTAAKRDLGYVPRVSIDEGMNRLAPFLRELGSR